MTSLTDESKFDLSIFKEEKECRTSIPSQCPSINRITALLKYYEMLNIVENEQHRDIFIHFIKEIYPNILDDNNHLITAHGRKLEAIHDELLTNRGFTECKMESCGNTLRHFRYVPEPAIKTALNNTDDTDDIDDIDLTIKFWMETMDSLHFYLFHSFHGGFRVKKQQVTNANNDDDDNKNTQCFDKVFARINKAISSRAASTKSFERFSIKNSKFNINDEEKMGEDLTFLDAMHEYLLSYDAAATATASYNNVRAKVSKWRNFINYEDYDTESIQYDCNTIENGNICTLINNTPFYEYLKEFITSTQITSGSFSIGYRWYYWDYYKSLSELSVDERVIKYMIIDPDLNTILNADNTNSHSGHVIRDLFITCKYTDFKEESTNYKSFDIKQYKAVVIKAEAYIKSAMAKAITAVDCDDYTSPNNTPNHYDIAKGAALTLPHLQSLLFYTDWTDLSTDFSATFRKKHAFETLNNAKKRNSAYFWMSKYLRELVEIYGQCSWGDERGKTQTDDGYICGYDNSLRGPMYTGMSVKMNIPQFSLRACSPTSTSIQIAVAIKFGGTQGMVLSLNNPKTPQYRYLRVFNCSWISRFKEEDERLVFGGFHRIKITCLRLMETKQNFGAFLPSLCYFDAMINGDTNMRDLKVNKTDLFIMKGLTERKTEKKKFDNYIYDTFHSFVIHKTQIVLDLHGLSEANAKMRDLIMHPLDRRHTGGYITFGGYVGYENDMARDANDFSNLFRKEIFDIFPKLNTIILHTTNVAGTAGVSYSVSMSCLLSIISSLSSSAALETIIIKAKTTMGGGNENWIKSLWDLPQTETMKKEYAANGFRISLKEGVENFYGSRKMYWFLINRI